MADETTGGKAAAERVNPKLLELLVCPLTKTTLSYDEAAGELISKAIGIIGGLREGLDSQQGGEIAANLDRLYEYMVLRLVEANIGNDVTLIDEVADLLRNVKSGWDAISH